MVSEITALRATWDPMFIIERRTVTTSETITELRGMFQPGVTWFVLAFNFPRYCVRKEGGLHMRKRTKREVPRLAQTTRAVAMRLLLR